MPSSASVPTTTAGRYSQVPVLNRMNAIVVLILNIFLPGIGTMVAGAIGKQSLIGRGIAQLLLSIIFIGWIWALVTSIQVLTNSTE